MDSSQKMNNNMGFDFDSLLCSDEDLNADFGSENGFDDSKDQKDSVFIAENESDWCDDEVKELFSKEKVAFSGYSEVISDGSLMEHRKIAVDWMLGVISYYGFSFLTSVCALNYFDRYVSRICFHKEKPWMSQLVAVGCLSVAAKVNESRVPLLLDLQIEDAKFIFEPKTIMRMELMILTTLEWKMHPVTPISFIDYVARRLEMKGHMRSKFVGRCEHILLTAINDPKFGSYLPSVLAAGTMLHAFEEIEPDNVMDSQNELLNILELSRDKVADGYKFISGFLARDDSDKNLIRKRKYPSVPNSPSGVVDAYFSSDSSNDSWYVAQFGRSSPEPAFKRNRSHDVQMRVASLRNL